MRKPVTDNNRLTTMKSNPKLVEPLIKPSWKENYCIPVANKEIYMPAIVTYHKHYYF